MEASEAVSRWSQVNSQSVIYTAKGSKLVSPKLALDKTGGQAPRYLPDEKFERDDLLRRLNEEVRHRQRLEMELKQKRRPRVVYEPREVRPGDVIEIRRYDNRKMYCYNTTSYVTLKEVLAFVKRGFKVRVISAAKKTAGHDQTTLILKSLLKQSIDQTEVSEEKLFKIVRGSKAFEPRDCMKLLEVSR